MFMIVTLLSFVNLCTAQAKIGAALNETAKEISQYTYFYSLSGLNDIQKESVEDTADTRADADTIVTNVSESSESFAKAVKDGTEYAGKTFGKSGAKIGKTDSGIFFSYSDYLRIFLYIQLCAAEDNVYLRTVDVIQANMSKNSDLTEYLDNFEMGRALTYFNIQADVRVKPLMLTLPYAQQSGADALDTDSWNTFTIDTITRGY